MKEILEKYEKLCREALGLDNVFFYRYSQFKNGYEIIGPYDIEAYIKDSQNGVVVYLYKGEPVYKNSIASFTLLQMPGCCGVCISTGAYVQAPYQKKGLGKILNSFRKEIAREHGYTVLMCTDIDANVPQKKILDANGFKHIHQFVNKRTGNLLNISVIDL